MKRKLILPLILLISLCLILSSCTPYLDKYTSDAAWHLGFGSEEISLPEDTDKPLYIAGYHSGVEVDGILDIPRANAVWMDSGEGGVLLIGVDCIGLGGGTVDDIRHGLVDFCRSTGCVSVNVYSTHTHAGIDTLGLWGPAAVDGKNPEYMSALINAAINAAKAAYEDRSAGALYYGSAATDGLQYDSREPIEYDSLLHQIRFVSDDPAKNGIRLLSYGAHAESLRGENRKLSRDFPGMLSEIIRDACGDDVMYMPGAVGGLIMTKELIKPFDAEENMRATARILADAALSVTEEIPLSPTLALSRVYMDIPLDNTFFFFAKFLGILNNKIKEGESETGYLIQSELSVLSLGSVSLALIPGEIFPELVSGRGLSTGDPEALEHIASRYNVEKLLIVGLCNDELGYIVPPGDYLLNSDMPYLETVTDSKGENHYEETNSVGIQVAEIIASSFEKALQQQNN